MAYTHNGILFNLKKEEEIFTRYNMDESLRYAKWSKLVTKGQILYDCSYYGVSRVVKFIATESAMVFSRGQGRGEWGVSV